MTVTVDQVEALLPQTQCGECNYPGCRPYAEAIIHEQQALDRCPPGGVATLRALGECLGKPIDALLPDMQTRTRAPSVAIIREAECIGCTKCIQACPVDAILGSGKQMHTVISLECTGCGLCVEPCPVDCIDLQTLSTPQYDRARAKQRYQNRQQRLRSIQSVEEDKHQRAAKLVKQPDQTKEIAAKQDYIKAAMARVKAKRDALGNK